MHNAQSTTHLMRNIWSNANMICKCSVLIDVRVLGYIPRPTSESDKRVIYPTDAPVQCAGTKWRLSSWLLLSFGIRENAFYGDLKRLNTLINAMSTKPGTARYSHVRTNRRSGHRVCFFVLGEYIKNNTNLQAMKKVFEVKNSGR